MKKLIVLLLFFIFTSIAAAQDVSDNIVEGAAGGDKIMSSTNLQKIDDEEAKYFYRREAIFSLNRLFAADGRPSSEPKFVNLVKVVEEPNTTASGDAVSTDNATVIVRGYCITSEDVYVNVQPSALAMTCNTNIGIVEIFGSLQPVNEAKSLIYHPIHLDYSGYRYKVYQFTTTNEARTSYNVATYVNDRKLAEIGYSTTIVAADEIGKSTSEYLQQLQESKRQETVEYVSVNNGNGTYAGVQPIQITNVERPDWSDYLAIGAVNILTSTVKTAAEIFRKDLPYLYDIAGGSKIYVDLVVYKKGERIE